MTNVQKAKITFSHRAAIYNRICEGFWREKFRLVSLAFLAGLEGNEMSAT